MTRVQPVRVEDRWETRIRILSPYASARVFQEGFLMENIQAAGGLVHHQDVWVHEHGAGNADALPLAPERRALICPIGVS